MTRLSADHPTVTTYEGTVVRYGTRRDAIAVPVSCPLSTTVLRVTADGTEWFMQPQTDVKDRWLLTGLYDRPEAARTPDEQSPVLAEWLTERELTRGRTVFLDVIVDELKYGLRGPGEEAVYEAPDTTAAGLQNIARKVDRQTDE